METKKLFMGETEKVQQLAAALRGDIEQFIVNYKEDFEGYDIPSDRLKAKELAKVVTSSSRWGAFNFGDERKNPEVTHKIGDTTYHKRFLLPLTYTYGFARSSN